ncbi:hypothetical protein EMIT079MI2_190096 [Bacillus sp. IT-79MI2]
MRKCYKTLSLVSYKIPNFIRYSVFFSLAAIQKNTQEITKILIPLFHLVQKNGRKSHRYEKKTVFDIMGVVYAYDGLRRQKKAASFLRTKSILRVF